MQHNSARERVIIEDRFRGPPRSGNGGYVGGKFASLLGLPSSEPVEVTLRAPVPLDAPMDVVPGDDVLSVKAGDVLIGEVRRANLDLTPPAPPSFEQALAAQPGAISLQVREGSPVPGMRGMHPICFCCGEGHDEGLHVYAARIDDTQVAAAWKTDAAWADESGNIPVEFLWTALDCPGQIAFAVEGIRTGLLGRITAVALRDAPAGEDYVVTAWRDHIEGKKHFAGSAIFDSKGALVAKALSIWIGRRDT
ncbi:MAG: hypothetical protein KDI19_04505 [Pseudomonadales bacterium]|nr:hypothetical protein [Pseudomonadales bacterium]